MVGVSIEATLELWACSLRDVKARMRPLFRRELAASAERFLDGLLGEERRKTGWMRAEAAGDPGPSRKPSPVPPGRLPKVAWRRLSAGDGAKGERLHDWVYLDLADLDAGDYDDALSGVWTRGLLIRRKIADGDLAYFSTWAPSGTPIETLVKVEGHRWAIEDSFETAKNELGLDHNETRSPGQARGQALARLASSCLAGHARLCHAGHHPPPPWPDLPTLQKR